MAIPIVRSGERASFKRCQKQWYWRWRKGYVPRARKFDALELGTWWHSALARWYLPGIARASVSFAELFEQTALDGIDVAIAEGVPEHSIESAEELLALGIEMARAYQKEYGRDKEIYVLATEITLHFDIPYPGSNKIAARHRITPDLVFVSAKDGSIWFLEHKTAKSIRTEHLIIDDQARPYSAMARQGLIKAGLMERGESFGGMLYNFSRKALPDLRPKNAEGKYLNKNGSISKSQPPKYFERKPLTLSRAARVIALNRVQAESVKIAETTRALRTQKLNPDFLQKTPHHSCPRFCEFWAMCVAEEQGADVSTMEHEMFDRVNPYEKPETSDEVHTFEMG